MYTFTTITQPSSDTKHPLILLQSVHGEKYMFGKIAEGSQRSLTENKIRISKLENIFITGELSWSAIGGLPGMILTIADQGKDTLVLHYGSNIINYVVSTWRYFVFRFGISLSTNTTKSYKDKLLSVNSISVTPSTTTPSTEPITKKESLLFNSIVSRMFPKNAPTSKYDPSSDPHLNVKLPQLQKVTQSSTSYEIVFNPIRGRFKAQEAIKLGVPKGPLFAKLTKGESITLENGTTVSPEQVLEKERAFAKVLILDIPNDTYIESFMREFANYDSKDLGIIYYFLDESVTINDQLIKFMDQFNNNCQHDIDHIVSHKKISPNNISYMGSTITTLKLKALQNDSYNLPRTNQLLSKEFYDCFSKTAPEGTSMVQQQETDIIPSQIKPELVHILSRDTIAKVEPFTVGSDDKNCSIDDMKGNIKIDRLFPWKDIYNSHIKPLDIATVTYESLISSQLNYNNFDNTLGKSSHVEVVTLGTGSALPSKYRNVVSTLLKIPFMVSSGTFENRNVLFDAGENTIGTMRRMFSSIELSKIFKDLKMIYLSHLHADHHLGIISIMKEWYKNNNENPEAVLYVVTPWQYNKFVTEWLSLEFPELIKRIRYVSCEHLVDDNYVRKEIQPIDMTEFTRLVSLESNAENNKTLSKKRKLSMDDRSSYRDVATIRRMYEDLHINNFQTCRAIHCNWAYSNTIDFQMNCHGSKNFKVSYSGDTRPNIKKFSRGIGLGSDLLIHEATLDNELQEDAIKKRHCTINEAIGVANAMEVQKLILTHFSQRYPKAPSIDGNIDIKAKEYCFAFDGMIVDFEKLGEQKNILPLLSKVFVDEAKDEDGDEEIE